MRPATTGSGAPGSQAQTNAPLGRSEVEVVIAVRGGGGAHPGWKQGDGVLAPPACCGELVAAQAEEVDADEVGGVEHGADADSGAACFDAGHGAPVDAQACRGVAQAPATSLASDPYLGSEHGEG